MMPSTILQNPLSLSCFPFSFITIQHLSSPPPPPPPHHRYGATTIMQQCADKLANHFDNLNLHTTTNTTTTATTATIQTKLSTSLDSKTPKWDSSSHISSTTRTHAPPRDPCWDAIQCMKSDNKALDFDKLHVVNRLGSGDIGTVCLVELEGSKGCLFAAKVMDKKDLVSRNKEARARVEREILKMLDHPFLPTLYATLDSERWSCLLTEFCPGGDLHVLRQCQPDQRFREASVRFFASEVVAALEYLHMMGIIYRDLKPENVLIRSDGHIMLTDFDLSLIDNSSTSTAHLVCGLNPPITDRSVNCHIDQLQFGTSSCILSNCRVPTISCFHPKRKRKKEIKSKSKSNHCEIVAEPSDIRSMSFVGTHEYLAPEIASGEEHGNAVDWWTLGIFIYEMLYGVTPFKGINHELTLANIVARAVEFPKEPNVPGPAKDLITQLLTKDPSRRLGSAMGATAIKHHPFFNGVNWALLRCNKPPFIPRPFAFRDLAQAEKDKGNKDNKVEFY